MALCRSAAMPTGAPLPDGEMHFGIEELVNDVHPTLVLGALSASLLPVPAAIAQSDPLPSWNGGTVKKVFAFEP